MTDPKASALPARGYILHGPRGALGSTERAHRYQSLYGAILRPVRELQHYVRGEFQNAPGDVNGRSRRASDVGLELSNRIISRLEVSVALTQLPYRERRCIQLRDLEQLTVEETAKRLGISTSTAGDNYRRGYERLADLIFRDD